MRIFKFDFIFKVHFEVQPVQFLFHPLFKSNRPMKGYLFIFSQTPFPKCTTNISFMCDYAQVTSTPVIIPRQHAADTSLVNDVTEFISTEFPLTLYSISGINATKLSMTSHKHTCLQLIYRHMYATYF